jgi:hypothetical protein
MAEVEVYRNLKYKDRVVYSIRDAKTKLVLARSENVLLRDVDFRVSLKGNARVRAEKRKNVHAVVRGTLLDISRLYGKPMLNVKYNPYEHTTFVLGTTLTPILSAKYVALNANGCWAVL